MITPSTQKQEKTDDQINFRRSRFYEGFDEGESSFVIRQRAVGALLGPFLQSNDRRTPPISPTLSEVGHRRLQEAEDFSRTMESVRVAFRPAAMIELFVRNDSGNFLSVMVVGVRNRFPV